MLRAKVESAGVFVLLIGNLGSHHSALGLEAFRGFALADPIAPFIVINDQDAKAAWSFTLLHELAHLWVGATGVSGQFTEGQLERFYNVWPATSYFRVTNFLLSESTVKPTEIQQHC